MRPLRNVAAGACVALASACASAPPLAPLVPPPVSIEKGNFAGSMLTGTVSETTVASIDPDPLHALSVHFDLLYMERYPIGALEPIPSRSRVIFARRGGAPIQPTARLGSHVRVGSGDDARVFLERLHSGDLQRFIEVDHWTTALPRGATVTFGGAAVGAEPDDATFPTSRTTLEVSRAAAGDGLEVALLMESRVRADVADDEDDTLPQLGVAGDPKTNRWTRVRETAVLEDAPAVGGPPVVLFARPARDNDEGALALVVRVNAAPVEEKERELHAAALQQCLADIAQSGRAARDRAADVTNVETDRRKMASALRSLFNNRSRRGSLVYLAAATNAPLAEDVALVADDEVLVALAKSVLPDPERIEADAADPDALAWRMERSTFRLLARRARDGGEATALDALLLRHAGEMARSPASLEDALNESSSVGQFHVLLTHENRDALEDGIPASRVRAFDWLAARGLAPPGFDPLAPLETRRAALAKVEEKP